jgi:glucose dehydrogenase
MASSAAGLAAMLIGVSADRAPVDWAFWGGDAGSAHYSKLADVNIGNASQLRQAWVWKTGESGAERVWRAARHVREHAGGDRQRDVRDHAL